MSIPHDSHGISRWLKDPSGGSVLMAQGGGVHGASGRTPPVSHLPRALLKACSGARSSASDLDPLLPIVRLSLVQSEIHRPEAPRGSLLTQPRSLSPK